MANRFILKNNFSTTLAAGISAAQTTATVADATGISTPGAGQGLRLTLQDPLDPAANEIISVTAVSGDTLTIVRAQEGTTAAIWPIGTKVELRLTAGVSDNFPQINVSGNPSQPTGTDSIALGRSAVASATYSLSIGRSTSASAQDATAMGRSAAASGIFSIAIGQEATATASSAASFGNGADALGASSLALGPSAAANGAQSVSAGAFAAAFGERSVSVGRGAFDTARAVEYHSHIGGFGKYAPFSYSATYGGYEFVDQHDYWYSGIVADDYTTAVHQLRKITLYSCIPLQLGDAAWPGAAATVKHGQSIRVGSYIYTSYIFGTDYFVTGTTGATEPTWPTVPGDSVMDNEVEWLCVGTSIEWTLPDYARFVPVSVGAIVRWCTPGGAVTYPQITAGINGDLDKWLAATTLSKLTGNYSQHFADVTNTEGAKQFGIDLTTAGTDLDCTAVLAVTGYIVESDVA
jgi:autotransporter adhesin